MEKTIKSLVLLMIITGAIFTLTACDSGIGSQYPEKAEEDIAAVEVSDKDDVVSGENEAEENEEEEADDDEINENSDSALDEKAPEVLQNDNLVSPDPNAQYDDGTYTKEATYQTPETQETILVSVTLKDNLVTGVVVTGKTEDETSKKFQALFISGVNDLVVGKRLDEIGQLSAVNGSSLTPNGFNAAVALLSAEAKK